MEFKIVENLEQLKIPCKPCDTWEEGREIAKKLIQCLEQIPEAIGIAANQIGLDKRVLVLWFERDVPPYTFINPRILHRSVKKLGFDEGCLSFPGQIIPTLRNEVIRVEHLTKGGYYVTDRFEASDPSSTLFTVAMQHEIDHLDGVTMHDRQYLL